MWAQHRVQGLTRRLRPIRSSLEKTLEPCQAGGCLPRICLEASFAPYPMPAVAVAGAAMYRHPAAPTCERGDVDDAALLALHHARGKPPCERHGGKQVDGHEVMPGQGAVCMPGTQEQGAGRLQGSMAACVGRARRGRRGVGLTAHRGVGTKAPARGTQSTMHACTEWLLVLLSPHLRGCSPVYCSRPCLRCSPVCGCPRTGSGLWRPAAPHPRGCKVMVLKGLNIWYVGTFSNARRWTAQHPQRSNRKDLRRFASLIHACCSKQSAMQAPTYFEQSAGMMCTLPAPMDVHDFAACGISGIREEGWVVGKVSRLVLCTRRGAVLSSPGCVQPPISAGSSTARSLYTGC